MNLVLVRHLRTPWNDLGWLQGSRDISITPVLPQSLKQLSAYQKIHPTTKWDKVLVSELARTRETARSFGVTYWTVEPLLNELNFGCFEGISKAAMLSEIGACWTEDPVQLEFGESMRIFQERLHQLIAKYSSHSEVLAFSHGATIRGLVAIAKYGNINKMNTFDVPNGAVVNLNF